MTEAARPPEPGTGAPAIARGFDRLDLPILPTNAWLRFDGIRRALREARPSTVLEVGTGEGALGEWLARHHDYTGVERDDVSRAVAQARLARVGRGDVLADLGDVGDRRFDAVCAFEVLEHIPDDAAALAEWSRFVAPGGWLLLSVPAHAKRYGAHDELAGHCRRYERAELTSRLEGAGFRVVRLSSHGIGLGYALEHARNLLARRHTRDGSLEERTSASGRYLQPHRLGPALACATLAAPFRVLQRPFAEGDRGTGYVVLARAPA